MSVSSTSTWYQAPELMVTPGNYSNAIDVWAAACVIFEMCTGLFLCCYLLLNVIVLKFAQKILTINVQSSSLFFIGTNDVIRGTFVLIAVMTDSTFFI